MRFAVELKVESEAADLIQPPERTEEERDYHLEHLRLKVESEAAELVQSLSLPLETVGA